MKTSRSLSRSVPETAVSKSPLVRSAGQARREAATLRRGRERLEEAPRPDETSARTAIAARRRSSA